MTDPVPYDDAAFLEAFERCTIPAARWTHALHIRMAWNYLQRHPFDAALTHVRDGIRRFNAAHGVVDTPTRGYHESITRAWLVLVAAARRDGGPEPDSLTFCAQNPELLGSARLLEYYTRDRLLSAEARLGWVEPDRAPLPGVM